MAKTKWLRQRGGRWHYQFQHGGRLYSGSTGLEATRQQQTAALSKALELRRMLEQGQEPPDKLSVIPFSDAAREFLAASELSMKISSHRRIKVSLVSAEAWFGARPVSLITPADVEAYRDHRLRVDQCRAVTARHDCHALSGLFQWGMKRRACWTNPVREVEIPSDREAIRMHVITAEEERRYFGAASRMGQNRADLPQDESGGSLLYDLARIMLNQGCRPAELLALAKADVDLERGVLRITAGKTAAARRTLTLTAESRAILGRRMVGVDDQFRDTTKMVVSTFVFSRARDVHMPASAHSLEHAHQRVREASGVECVLYDLRHTFATRMAQARCDLATLAAILGHSSIRLVMRYVHPTEQHQAAAMQAFEARWPAQKEIVQ